MAEIHVQRKERIVWPWLLGALILGALFLWLVWERNDDPQLATVADTDSTAVANTPATAARGSSVTQYLQFVDARTSRAVGLAHEYTAEGLWQLAAALHEVADEDSVGSMALQSRIDDIRQQADVLRQDPNSTAHAGQARDAFTVAAALIADMSGTMAPTAADNLPALQAAATAIEPASPLLDQADRIEEFFEQAGKALRQMTGRAT